MSNENEMPLLIINDNGEYINNPEKERHYKSSNIIDIIEETLYQLTIERQEENVRCLSLTFQNVNIDLVSMVIPITLKPNEYIELESLENDTYDINIKSYGNYTEYKEEEFPILNFNMTRAIKGNSHLECELIINRMGESICVFKGDLNSNNDSFSLMNVISFAVDSILEGSNKSSLQIFQSTSTEEYCIIDRDGNMLNMYNIINDDIITTTRTDNTFKIIKIKDFIINNNSYTVCSKSYIDEIESEFAEEDLTEND